MPVIIRGSGGGKKIKDATALPPDVKKGKIFYNNDGRQVGTAEDDPLLNYLKSKFGENVKTMMVGALGTGYSDSGNYYAYISCGKDNKFQISRNSYGLEDGDWKQKINGIFLAVEVESYYPFIMPYNIGTSSYGSDYQNNGAKIFYKGNEDTLHIFPQKTGFWLKTDYNFSFKPKEFKIYYL